ncbi:MAG: diguanylate cyclase [Chloroflexi bacterium]|nr:diguanylate cyclase [Chloroflexota bacterium]
MSSIIKQNLESGEEHSFREMEGLKHLAQIISANTSQKQALIEALKVVAETLQVKKALLLQYDARTNCLVSLTPVYGFEEEELADFRINFSQTDKKAEPQSSYQVFITAFQETAPFYLNETNLSFKKDKVHNILAVPIQIEGHKQGVCAVMNKIKGSFDDKDAKTLLALSVIMATLLKNLNMINHLEAEKRRHLAMLDAAVDGFIEVGRDFRISLFSKGAESLTGWKAEDVLGRTCSEVLLPHAPHAGLLCQNCPLMRSFRYGISVSNVEVLIRTHDGEDNWVSSNYNVVTDDQGEVVSGVIAIKDIYRIKALSDELRQQIQQQESLLGVINAINGLSSIEEIYSKALGEVGNAIEFDLGMIHLIKENEELVLMAISEPETLAGLSTEAKEANWYNPNASSKFDNKTTLQNPIANFKLEAVDDKEFQHQERVHRLRRHEITHPVLSGRNYNKPHHQKTVHNCEALRQNEPYMAVNLPGKETCGVLEGFDGIQSHLCVPIKTQEQTYGILHLGSYRPYAFWGSDFALALSICKQIAVAAERAHLFEQVDLLARTDPLTKLYNKREFWDRIEREMKRAERQQRPLSLMVMDLDRLKWYNDFYGHSHGDVLLAHIGQLIRDKCRNTDIPFRYGGDELCLLLPDTQPLEAFIVAERIRTSAVDIQVIIDEVIIGAEEECRVTMSIGIASFPTDATSGTELFENADSAMYRAKEIGKNRSVIYDRTIDVNKLNFRKRVRPSEYVDDRLKPATPHPPILNHEEQIIGSFKENSTELEIFEDKVGSPEEFSQETNFTSPPQPDLSEICLEEEINFDENFQPEELE